MGAVPLPRLLREEVASNGGSWLPVVLVLRAIAAVAYADHIVVSISLVYLYILPLAVSVLRQSNDEAENGNLQIFPVLLNAQGC
jgi:hypothetical protein